MAKNLKDIVIVSALRTPIGKLKGIWSKHGAPELGAKVILEVLNQSKVPSSDIDEIIMGQVLTGNTGQNPARQAAMMAGIPIEKTAYIINQVCGSGLRAVVAGYQSILSGDCEAVIVGGQESMTNSKEELMLKDGLIDAYKKYHMGITAENVAEKFQISRKEQDKFAVSSQLKAQEAIKNNKFKEEMINGDKLLDEHLITLYRSSRLHHPPPPLSYLTV